MNKNVKFTIAINLKIKNMIGYDELTEYPGNTNEERLGNYIKEFLQDESIYDLFYCAEDDDISVGKPIIIEE